LIELIKRADLVCLVLDLQAYPIAQFQDSLALLEDRRIVPEQFRDRYTGERRMFLKPLLGLVNKVDDEQFDEEFDVLCELLDEADCPLLPVSAVTGRNIEQFKQVVFERLEIIRIYSKPPGEEPDYNHPFVLKEGDTIEVFAVQVHKDFAEQLRSARVWGSSVFDGQQVGRDHQLHDGDVVELRT
jgi:ribosome-interacting GTPase 1